MRRCILTLAALGTFALSACAPAEVVVTAQIEQDDPTQEGVTQTLSLGNMEVELLPFDRDLVFDSLEAAAERPEPPVPPELQAAQDAILEAQARWQSLETQWNTLRDTLEKLNNEIARYNRGEARYIALYSASEELHSRYDTVDRQKAAAFEEYDSLQLASTAQLEAIRIERANWADEVFQDVDVVFDAKMDEAGREILTDTTSTDGVAVFDQVKPGQWWVHARFELPTVELYWNVPVEVPKGETVQFPLTRANAEERPIL